MGDRIHALQAQRELVWCDAGWWSNQPPASRPAVGAVEALVAFQGSMGREIFRRTTCAGYTPQYSPPLVVET